MKYTGDAYRNFNIWLKKLKPMINNNLSEHKYFDFETTISRVFQIITEKTSEEYNIGFKNGNIRGNNVFGPLKIYKNKLTISVKSRIFFNCLFILESTYLFLLLVKGIFKTVESPKKYSVLFEPPITDLTEFKNFLTNTQIPGLNKLDYLVIKKRYFRVTRGLNPKISKNPWTFIVTKNFSVSSRIKICCDFLAYTINSLIYLNKCNLNVLLYRDLPSSFLVNLLNKKKQILNLFITNSSFQSQPLWLNGLNGVKFKSHMIWYSQNFIPKFHKGESKQSYLPGSDQIRVDYHWLWTKKFGDLITKLNPKSKYHAINSIMFYSNKIQNLKIKNRVIIFDVIPIESKNKVFFGAINYYYTKKTISKFVKDIVESVETINRHEKENIEVVLKTKRPQNKNHNKEYFHFLNELKKKYTFFKIANSNSNIYRLISEAFISFSVPFTSTAEVAYELKTPTYFYDSSNSILPNYETNHIPLLYEGKELIKVIKEAKIKNLT